MPTMNEKKTAKGARVYDEHSIVVLLNALETEDGIVPAGTRGVVQDALPDGSAYLVEFDDPFFCVVEVPGKELHPG